jgi:hypothetical protein
MLVVSPYFEIELTVTHVTSGSQFEALEAVVTLLPKDGVMGW